MFGFPLGKGLLYMDEPYALIPNVLLSFFQQHIFSLVTSRSHGFIYDEKTLTAVCASIIFDPVFNN